MNAYRFKKRKLDRHWFAPIVEYLVKRAVLGSLAALIVYGGYRMFLH